MPYIRELLEHGKAGRQLNVESICSEGHRHSDYHRKFKNAPQQSRNERLTIELQKIVYADNWRELDQRGYRHSEEPQNMLFLHTKRKAFSSEREIRFRISPFGPDRAEIPLPACPEWFPVVFENLDWIEEVVAESSISSRAASMIRRQVNQHNLKFRVSEL